VLRDDVNVDIFVIDMSPYGAVLEVDAVSAHGRDTLISVEFHFPPDSENRRDVVIPLYRPAPFDVQIPTANPFMYLAETPAALERARNLFPRILNDYAGVLSGLVRQADAVIASHSAAAAVQAVLDSHHALKANI